MQAVNIISYVITLIGKAISSGLIPLNTPNLFLYKFHRHLMCATYPTKLPVTLTICGV